MSYVQAVICIDGARIQQQIQAGNFLPVEQGAVYDVWADTDTYISVVDMATNTAPTSSTGYKIPAGSIISVKVARDGQKMGASALTSIHRVE